MFFPLWLLLVFFICVLSSIIWKWYAYMGFCFVSLLLSYFVFSELPGSVVWCLTFIWESLIIIASDILSVSFFFSLSISFMHMLHLCSYNKDVTIFWQNILFSFSQDSVLFFLVFVLLFFCISKILLVYPLFQNGSFSPSLAGSMQAFFWGSYCGNLVTS